MFATLQHNLNQLWHREKSQKQLHDHLSDQRTHCISMIAEPIDFFKNAYAGSLISFPDLMEFG